MTITTAQLLRLSRQASKHDSVYYLVDNQLSHLLSGGTHDLLKVKPSMVPGYVRVLTKVRWENGLDSECWLDFNEASLRQCLEVKEGVA